MPHERHDNLSFCTSTRYCAALDVTHRDIGGGYDRAVHSHVYLESIIVARDFPDPHGPSPLRRAAKPLATRAKVSEMSARLIVTTPSLEAPAFASSLCLNVTEYRLVMSSSHSKDPTGSMIEGSDNYPDTGGRYQSLPKYPERTHVDW
jgi:hypothetical protein